MPDHRGYASNSPKNWASAPCQRTRRALRFFPQRENPIPDLRPKAAFVTPASHRAGIELINQLNADCAEHARAMTVWGRGFKLRTAARLQLSATEALDIAKEPDRVLRLYGIERGQSNIRRPS